MSDRRFTAQEMRKMAKSLVVDNLWPEWSFVVVMLRQAADTEEEMAKLKARLDGVINNLNIHLAGADQSVTMNRAEVSAMVNVLKSAIAEEGLK